MPDRTEPCELPRPAPLEPTWRGDPLQFDTWVEEDPGGMVIVVTAVLNAPDERRAKWREN